MARYTASCLRALHGGHMATHKANPADYLPEILWSSDLPGLSEQIRDHRQILVIEDDGLSPRSIAVVLHPDDFSALLAAAGRTH